MKTLQAFDANQSYEWNPEQPLLLPEHNCEMSLVKVESGLSADVVARPLTIRFRTGGERIKPIGRAHTMELKKLMQEAAIPPWQRSRIPLIYLDDKMIAVAGYWVADAYKNVSDQAAWQVISQKI